jgi:pimeloyl-ACP methyl ester carboxylesterase
MTALARSLARNTTLNPSSVSSMTSVPDQKPGSAVAIKNIVLVHGAFADGTSWYKVIPLLQQMGYNVVAAQNPMLSLAQEVTATKRAIAMMDGPVILVGHSWGGAVVTEAGDDPRVAGIVYISAYAPEIGQSANDASRPYGWTEGQKKIKVDAEGFATISPEGMLNDITEGLPMVERRLALAVQAPSYGALFDEKLTRAAWMNKPTWSLVSTMDRMVPPAMEAAAAKRMGAVTTVRPTCHMVIQQEPKTVAAIIDDAARKALSKQVNAPTTLRD